MGKLGNWHRYFADRFRPWLGPRQHWSDQLFPNPGAAPNSASWRCLACLLVLAVLAGVVLLPNQSYPLFEPDEGRRAEIGREILDSGDWAVCTLNRQPYYDKPPLFHWLVAASFALFGTRAAAARLVSALAAWLTVLVTYWLGRRMIGTRAAFIGALALLAMTGFVLAGRILGLDGTLTLWVTLSALLAHEALRGPRVRWGWWLGAALCCGLGVLTKGPVAVVLVVGPALLHVALSKTAARPRLVHAAAFLAVTAMPCLPWVIEVLRRDPQLLYEFLVEHNLHRFAGGVAHERPWWFYGPVLALACLPWAPLLPWSLRLLTRSEPEARSARTRPLGYLLLSAGWCVAFFTASRGKLPLYILPALPPLALMVGWYLDQVLWRPQPSAASQFVRTLMPRLTLVAVLVAWAITGIVLWRRGMVGTSPMVATTVGAAIGLAALLVVLRRYRSAALAWAACAAVSLAVDADVAHRLVPALAVARWPLAAASGSMPVRGAALACPGQQWATFAFACRGDLLDTDHASSEQLWEFARAHAATFLIGAPGAVEDLRRECPAELWGEVVRRGDGWTILLLHRAANGGRP
jgi:dolichol-phosphate mannosyltransferase